jgi:alpha-L-rhamnosidase
MNNLIKMNIKFHLSSFLLSFLVCMLFSAYHHKEYSDIWIEDARLNSETNPMGIDTEKPDFSWKLKSDIRNQYQSAYQIVVLSQNPKDTCWNSEKIISDNNILLRYSAKPLTSVSSYQWKVRIWDENGKRYSCV